MSGEYVGYARRVNALASALRVDRLRWTPTPATAIFLSTRLGIWGACALALAWSPTPAGGYGTTGVTNPGGYGTTLWVRGDSNLYTQIARHGYGAAHNLPAFFPGYPTLVAGLGRAFGGNYNLAGLVISLVCCAITFELLWRLAASRLGAEGGSRAVLYLALFPMSVFLQAVYSESLFLAFAVGAFFLAERGRWPAAAVAGGFATLTRSIGVAVVVALAVM